MSARKSEGKFDVLDSFAIKRRKEFYVLGRLIEGIVQVDWFITIPLNSSFVLTIRIIAVEEVELSNDPNIYKLLIVSGDEETLNLLLGL